MVWNNKNLNKLVTGGVYLAAYNPSDSGFWLLLNDEQEKIEGVNYKPAKFTKNAIKLTWLYTNNFEGIAKINQSSAIWASYSLATSKVSGTPYGKGISDNKIRGKQILSSFWKQQRYLLDLTKFNQQLEESVSLSSKLAQQDRLLRLINSSSKPEKVEVKATVYKRNPDVVAEVLHRAKGICEHCNNPAPFLRDDNTPYLEVHHKIPLSEDGEDTIDNSLALCPNCHRHAHLR